MSATRTELLRDLIRFDPPPPGNALSAFEWDCDVPLVTLSAGDLTSVLERYSRGELAAPAVEEWVNAIEGRDDIEYSAVQDFIHELANPLLAAPLTAEPLGR